MKWHIWPFKPTLWHVPFDEHSLNFDLYNPEQLKTHAKKLAARHTSVVSHGRNTLNKRLLENEQILTATYSQLCKSNAEKIQISPAAEWLLDNFYFIDEQIAIAKDHFPHSYSISLPHLSGGENDGCPRVYNLAVELIAHVDGRIDSENLDTFLSSYQSVTPLKLGELWAVPIMVRLALIENLRRVAVRVDAGIADRRKARKWTTTIIEAAASDSAEVVLATADMARSNPPLSTSFIAEFVKNLQGRGVFFDLPIQWISHRLHQIAKTIEEYVQLDGHQQASNQFAVSASIGSLRFLNAFDWRIFVENHSKVELILRQDPTNDYPNMDFRSRDSYRHKVEQLAIISSRSEIEVSQLALTIARDEDAKLKGAGHIGKTLFGDYRVALRDKCGLKSSWALRFSSQNRLFTLALYGLSCLAFTTALTLVLGIELSNLNIDRYTLFIIIVLMFLMMSESGIAITNWIVTLAVKPQMLPRMDFSTGVPSAFKTIIVLPTLLNDRATNERLIEDLEVRFLANQNQNIILALLTDFRDAATENQNGDDALLEDLSKKIEHLNSKYGFEQLEKFHLLHRSRTWTKHENCWMGHERKRGKIMALNRLLISDLSVQSPLDNGFTLHIGRLESLKAIKYVLTIDTDTFIPSGAAIELVATMAHPLNRPVFDATNRRVVSGYSILQPRIAASLMTSNASRFSEIYSSSTGIDPYTKAVSDVYQDLFGEGSFIGKAIYDLESFSKSLADRLPDNLILSHDLIEGCYARCGFVSDILLFEGHPTHFGDDAIRKKRWIRGDWQIIGWLLPFVPVSYKKWEPNHLSLLSRWKIFDNLRRSLVAPASFLLLAVAFCIDIDSRPLVYAAFVSLILPIAIVILSQLKRYIENYINHGTRSFAYEILARVAIQSLLALIFLPQNAAISARSISSSINRMLFTKRRLLEWTASTDTRLTKKPMIFEFIVMFLFSLVMVTSIIAFKLFEEIVQHPLETSILCLWLIAPFVAFFISLPKKKTVQQLTKVEHGELSSLARRMWQFFVDLVNEEDNWLPPDNLQEYPSDRIAHRTSPTNIGLSLLSSLGAYDLGYLTVDTLIKRTEGCFGSLDRMERHRGHFYNWYDTKTLEPLFPKYVSTVDSGNLSAHLLTLKMGLEQLSEEPIARPVMVDGFLEVVRIAILTNSKLKSLQDLKTSLESIAQTTFSLKELKVLLTSYLTSRSHEHSSQIPLDDATWIDALNRQIQEFSEYCDLIHYDCSGITQTLATLPSEALPKALLVNIHRVISESQKILTLGQLARLSTNATNARDCLKKLNPAMVNQIKLRPSTDQSTESKYPEIETFLDTVTRCSANAESILTRAMNLGQRCETLAKFEFDFLYDKSRRHLSIGYNVSDHRLDSSFYDLLASEARLCSFLGVAMGELPVHHWFALGRQMTIQNSEPTLMSWSGSMFEYLMPILVMPKVEGSLLAQSYRTCVERQREYCSKKFVPWGISESGYNLTDIHLNYQYKAFGVPGLGFKRGLGSELVIAPYATMLALMVSPRAAFENLESLKREGCFGRYGYYEAIDYTSSRLPGLERSAKTQSFMSHHQAMGFLSIVSVLLDEPMQKRFASNPRFKSVEQLLHEKIPDTSTFYQIKQIQLDEQTLPESSPGGYRTSTFDTPTPEVHLLSNGRYSVMITNSGSGYSRWNDIAVTRWREDPTCDPWGSFFYLRDFDIKEQWSIGFQPTKTIPDTYEAIFLPSRAEFKRRDFEIETHLEVTVCTDDDIEVRRVTLKNISDTVRTIEITSYAEVVLSPQKADTAHPAFSGLFVESEILEAKQAIVVTRRSRNAEESHPVLVHFVSDQSTAIVSTSFETDRAVFWGRRHTSKIPESLEFVNHPNENGMRDQRLKNSQGAVLDPIVAIRHVLTLQPESSITVHYVTGIAKTKTDALSNSFTNPRLLFSSIAINAIG